jgi:hypothetical protein
MKPISLATFLGSMIMWFVSLYWFPDVLNIITAVMPVATPAYMLNFLAFLPYMFVGIVLVILLIKLGKRGKPKDFEQ